MKTQASNKVDQENQENVNVMNRKPLKALQEGTTDKENICSRTKLCIKCKLPVTKNNSDIKSRTRTDESIQTGEPVITVADLTGEAEPSADYWRLLAETRGKSLNDSIDENEKLQRLIESLEEENKKCKEMLDESRTLVEVLEELIEEESSTAENNS